METDRYYYPHIGKKLFHSAIRGEWEEVSEIYKFNEQFDDEISRSGGTALQLAVADGQEGIVEDILNIICRKPEDEAEKKIKAARDEAALKTKKDLETEISNIKKAEISKIKALRVEDEKGNTILHTAAMLGKEGMCKCIVRKIPSLIGARNRNGETPLFFSALQGHREAFLYLHFVCDSQQGSIYTRRKDGDTILHCAIAGEFYDMAILIIHLYPNLAHAVNEQGQTPLHLLAAKPFAFRSSSYFERFSQIIYNCTIVDRLDPDSIKNLSARLESNFDEPKFDGPGTYPENHETCCYFISILTKLVKEVIDRDALKRRLTRDAENPEGFGDGHARGHPFFPPNFGSYFEFVIRIASSAMRLVINNASKAMILIPGFGSNEIKKIRDTKQKHTWSVQVLDLLVQSASMYEYEDDGTKPSKLEELWETSPYGLDLEIQQPKAQYGSRVSHTGENSTQAKIIRKNETPILLAAKNGITEIIKRIINQYPEAIHDTNSDKKNVVLLAVENRQPHVYKLLLKLIIKKDTVFGQVDNEGNSALHLAAMVGEHNKTWLIPGAALQLQWELKWFEFVRDSMPLYCFNRYNKKGEAPEHIFAETHKDLVDTGRKWLVETSQSCSFVATLIATVAFATSAAIPGGIKEDSGIPNLGNQPAFIVFAISSLIALSFSITSLIMFLSILTSRYQDDVRKDLPRKLFLGSTLLFLSMGSMLVSFCAGHFFLLKNKLKLSAIPLYSVVCLPVALAIAQLPLYSDVATAVGLQLEKLPQRLRHQYFPLHPH